LNQEGWGVADPLLVLGLILQEFMEVDGSPSFGREGRPKLEAMFAKYGLGYVIGGRIIELGTAAVSRTLESMIRSRDLSGLQTEFERTLTNVGSDPGAAVTGACALLESLFKVYIEDEKLPLPANESIKPLWTVVQKNLKLDPAPIQDDDLRKILSGLSSIVDGIGSLRTHAGSAHGHGRYKYKLEPRHARLVAHAAFTLAMFVLETWDDRKRAEKPRDSDGQEKL
jgi:hypothetical protein